LKFRASNDRCLKHPSTVYNDYLAALSHISYNSNGYFKAVNYPVNKEIGCCPDVKAPVIFTLWIFISYSFFYIATHYDRLKPVYNGTARPALFPLQAVSVYYRYLKLK
jgi:hypothetical protein